MCFAWTRGSCPAGKRRVLPGVAGGPLALFFFWSFREAVIRNLEEGLVSLPLQVCLDLVLCSLERPWDKLIIGESTLKSPRLFHLLSPPLPLRDMLDTGQLT